MGLKISTHFLFLCWCACCSLNTLHHGRGGAGRGGRGASSNGTHLVIAEACALHVRVISTLLLMYMNFSNSRIQGFSFILVHS